MSRAKEKPGARTNEQTGLDTSKHCKNNCTRNGQPGQLHQSLNLLVDAAIAVDDAAKQTDVVEFDKAACIFNRNARTVKTLMRAWRSRYA